ncbi:TonB-dependent receptor [Altericroceibacterium spongiae]|uniref:TonB-dependent receptor n=1 Tax=Altericroceibacterium spongiae TaxID=2320269 RepID=A0A420EQQ9_9SPHN|nr:TonB-dependent receptor [Altericroceibacterium spongiae]RKF23004.1 TonB-dependent receptor [Altericroceibacterium spongiae]
MHTRALFLAGVTFSALLSIPVQAQDTGSDEEIGEEIIVTGTRAAGRTRLDSTSPVDVFSQDMLKRQGSTELATALATVAPSINFPRPAITDGTDAIRPATLRGLSPDQTLVLINGVRGHSSALLNVNGSVGRGSAAVDLNTIPTGALQSIEILRDGASAQYGSDAIAGVVNLRLREAREGGNVTASYGTYATSVETGTTHDNKYDGDTVNVNGWAGFGLGSEGFLTVSGEFQNRNPTSRGGLDPRVDPPAVTSRFGDPDVNQYTGYVNMGLPLGDSGWEAYGFGGYQYRRSQSAAFPRVPSNSNNVPEIYPDGFLPLIQTKSRDLTATGGIRGDVAEWNVDIGMSYGRNKIDFATLNTLNSTYGAESPTEFDDGALTYDQLIGSVDVTRQLYFGDSNTLNVAFGGEYRREGYQIDAGQPESYDRGPLGGDTTLTGGAQGFIGFNPTNEVDVHRHNFSGYLDLEARFADRFTLGVAGRVEDYSDFGTRASGKVSARFDITPSFALRGAISNGFRAPSLQQSYFTSTSSVIVTPDILETGTYPATSAVAQALGGKPLEPEKSTNYSVGAVFQSGPFNLTIDAYKIDIRDQLALSENIRTSFSQEVADILDPFDVQAARFFLNGVKTSTKGIDVVANYRLDTAEAGRFDLSLAGNVNDIDVKEVPEQTAALNPAPTLFARSRILTIEDGTPDTKITGTVDWTLGDFGLTLRSVYYASVRQPSNTPENDLFTGDHLITDLEMRFDMSPLKLAVGANNIFDVYPDRVPNELNSIGITAFPFYSPFGFNGRYMYVRASIDW